MKKKLALLLAFALILSLVPAGALLADDNDDNDYNDNGGYNDYYDDDEDNGVDADEDEDDADEDADDADEDADAADEDADEDDDAADEDADDNDVDEDEDEEVVLPPVTPVVPEPIAGAVTTLRFVIGETTFTRNNIPAELDAAPFIDAAVGRTMVPLAAIAEGLGATVRWDGETRYVYIVRGDVNLSLNIDTELPGGMGMPAIVDDRTFVPLAYVADELGATTTWYPDAQAVYIVD